MATPLMVKRKVSIVLCSLILIWALDLAPTYADVWNEKTIVTIDAPVRIPGKVLAPGSYVFKLADSSSDRHIVRIFITSGEKVQTGDRLPRTASPLELIGLVGLISGAGGMVLRQLLRRC